MRLSIADVRPSERAATFGAFLVLFGMMAAHALLETSRDALFLSRLQASRLPVVYLAIALLAVPLSLSSRGIALSRDRRRTLTLWLVFASVVTAAFWTIVARAENWSLYALYIWSGIFSTLSVVQFWIVVGDAFTVSQAKRLYALIGTGSILGAITGSIFAQYVATHIDTRAILLVAAGVLLGTACGPYLLPASEETAPPAGATLRARLRVTRELLAQPYVKRLALLALVSAVTLTLADYIFKSVVQSAVTSAAASGPVAMTSQLVADRLGWVFATAYLVFNCFSLLAQLTIVGWMTRKLPIDRVLALLPILLFASSLWLAIGGGILAAVFLKGFDGTLRHSLHRTATEVLYVPLAGEWRATIKSLVDVVGQRGGQALASLGILAMGGMHLTMPGGFEGPEIPLAAGVVLLCGAWVAIGASLKSHYFDVFRDTLNRQSASARLDYPDLDLASLETLIGALGRPEEREVVAALELLSEKGRTNLVPSVILYHPSPRVVLRALELFSDAGREDHLDLLERLLERPEGEVRQAALLRLPPNSKLRSLLERCVADDSPDVRATAIIGLLSGEETPHPRVASILETLVAAGSSEAKRALARAIRFSPSPRFDALLIRLAAGEDPRVCKEVAAAVRQSPRPVFLRALLPMLQWRECRHDARLAFVAQGPLALDFLTRAMRDSNIRLRVRRHLPRTISRFEPQAAAAVLAGRLLEEEDGVVRYKILRALGRIQTNHPQVKFDASILERALDLNVRRAYRSLDWRVCFARATAGRNDAPLPAGGLMLELLRHNHLNAIERVFRLLQLRYPREDFHKMYRGLESGSGRTRDSARELLEHVLPSPLREGVIGLIDDRSEAERLSAGERAGYAPQRTGNSGLSPLFGEILRESSSALRCIAAVAAGELRLRELEGDIAGMRDGEDEVLRPSYDLALELLRDPARVTPGT